MRPRRRRWCRSWWCRILRLKDLERENARLKRAVAELTLDKLILKEAAEGNF
jgi:hypothetical protein